MILPRVGVVAAVPAREPDRKGVFAISRVGSTEGALEVHYTVAGTATPGKDYVSLPGSVVIPDGENVVVVEVEPVRDDVVEGKESIEISLVATDAYALLDQATIDLALLDEDGRAVTIRSPDAWIELVRILPTPFPGNVCVNAQPQYRQAKWRVYMHPADGPAFVFLSQGQGIVNAFQGSITDGDTVEVNAIGEETGEYELTAKLPQFGLEAKVTGKAFKFTTKKDPDFKFGGRAEGQAYWYATEWEAHVRCPYAMMVWFYTSTARVNLDGTLRVVTVPANAYDGNVKAKLYLNSQPVHSKYEMNAWGNVAISPFIIGPSISHGKGRATAELSG